MNNAHLCDWTGKQETCQDSVSSSLVKRVAATFGVPCPENDQILPYLWHWAFFQEPVMEGKLGRDGHPERSLFTPTVRGRHRMWAGGRVHFYDGLRIGQNSERRSTILSVKEKDGKTGSLLFVTVLHEYFQLGKLCISEEQDIVYRKPSPPKLSSTTMIPQLDWVETVTPSSIMLFRYSAVTFNSHRIHYDFPYATQQEDYPGLVVHGPMIATLILKSFIEKYPQYTPIYFTYRGLRPLIADNSFQIGCKQHDHGKCELWAYSENGPAHQAELEYKDKL